MKNKSNDSVNVPEEIKKWNWGAFFLNIIWGIAHRIYFSLLFFIPFVGFIVPFVLGFKGNEWAWQKNDWESIEEFKKSQKKWFRAAIGVIVGGLFIAILVSGIMFYSFGKMEPVKDALEKVNNSSRAVYHLGNDIEKGSFWFSGSVNISGANGEAKVSFPVEGNKGEGTLYMIAKKEMGVWEIKKLVLEVGEENYRFDLLKETSGNI